MMLRRHHLPPAAPARRPAAPRPFRSVLPAATLALAACLAGCLGGSGSSGFDISPLAESRFIDAALADRQCVDANGLPICPTDTGELVLPGSLDQPVPGAQAPEAATGFGDGASACRAGDPEAASCRLDVQVDVSGVPSGSVVVVAWRSAEPQAVWTLGAGVDPAAGATLVPAFLPDGIARVQVALLVYFAGDAAVAGTVTTLAEAEPDLVFVSVPFDVTPF